MQGADSGVNPEVNEVEVVVTKANWRKLQNGDARLISFFPPDIMSSLEKENHGVEFVKLRITPA